MAARAGGHATDPVGALRGLSAFSGLPERTITQLEPHVTWLELPAGQRLAPRVAGGESYHFVQRGRINIIVDDQHSDDPQEWQFVGSFAQGDFFSDGYTTSPTPRLDCVADVSSVLASIPQAVLARVMKAQPRWAEALRQRNRLLRDAFRDNRPASRRLVQDFFLRHGYGFANSIKVIQLDRCINCDACEKSCAARHGIARLSRFGPSLGALGFPISCRDCADHRCAEVCVFDAITVEDDGSVVIDARKCVGCSACHNTCPNQAITMVQAPYTGADFPNPMPQTDREGLTNVDGLYLIGEASGDALIKIAINSGVRAVEAIAESHRPSAAPGVHDVAIVGAGPAGLSAALACQERGLSYVLLDKGTFATTIQAYPRNKLVMAEPAHVPLYGQLWLRDTTKEELIAKWQEIIDATGLQIQSHEEVTDIRRAGSFSIQSTRATRQAHNVIVAVGTRGAPRRLGLDGETPDRVHYLLTDPGAHAGRCALVVGGGDSAIEGAASLADAGATVTLSYRRDTFARAKKRNRDLVEQYAAAGRIEVVLESKVTAIEPNRVRLATRGGDRVLENDVIFAMLGAEPPTKFFETIGIDIVEPGSDAMERLAATRGMRQFASKCDNCIAHDGRACVEACPTGALVSVEPAEVFGREHFTELPFLIGLQRSRGWMWLAAAVALLIGLATGLEAFLRAGAPEMSLLHHWHQWRGTSGEISFSPGRGLGLGLGIAGASLMTFACLYPLSSRLGWFQWLAKKRLWMAAHIIAGVLGPVLVTWHTGLKLDRWPSIAFWAAWLVVLSGFAGRYLRSWFRRTTGLAELEMQSLEKERAKLFSDWKTGVGDRTGAYAASDLKVTAQPPAILVPLVLLNRRVSTWVQKTYLQLFGLRKVRDRAKRRALVRNFVERARAERAQILSEGVTRSAAIWRVVHLLLTITLVAVAALHIWFGYLFMAT